MDKRYSIGTSNGVVVYVTALTYATTRISMTSGIAPLAHWSVSQKLNHVSLVQFSYVALYAP